MQPPNDGRSTLLSPEGVALDLPLCGPGPRILAYAADFFLIAALALLLFLLLVFVTPLAGWLSEWAQDIDQTLEDKPGDSDALLLLMLPLIVAFVLFASLSETLYFTFWELVTGGRSPGKVLLGLRVVGAGGAPLDFRSSLIRNLLRIVDVLPSSYLLGLISIVLSSGGQRLGDHAADTFVIRTDRVQPAPPVDFGGGLQPLALSRSQLENLGVPELSLARGTLRRLDRTSGERRQALIQEAVSALRQRLGLEEDSPEDPVRFLKQVVITAEREARRH